MVTKMMITKELVLGGAFLRKEPCQITYRDKSKRWTRRTIRIEKLEADHLLAHCELRNNYRTFRLAEIASAASLDPSIP